MLPAGDGTEDAIGVGGSDEGLGMFFVLGDVAVDGGLEIDERAEDPTRDAASGAAAGKDAPNAVTASVGPNALRTPLRGRPALSR